MVALVFFVKQSVHPLFIRDCCLSCTDGGGRWRSPSQLSPVEDGLKPGQVVSLSQSHTERQKMSSPSVEFSHFTCMFWDWRRSSNLHRRRTNLKTPNLPTRRRQHQPLHHRVAFSQTKDTMLSKILGGVKIASKRALK